MIREVCDLLSDNNISKKLVLLGHNMHLTKKSDQITSFNLCGQQVPMWNSVGTYIAEKFRDQVFSVWMLCGSGTHSGPHFSSSQQSFSNLDLFVEAILSSVPWHAFCLPLSSAPNIVLESLSETMFGCNGEPAQGSLRAQADMIVFIREVTAL
jgi:erythromycin esterase-like protein